MMEDARAEAIEEEYGMPPGRLMYHFYHEEEMTVSEIAGELGTHRNNVKRWLQHSGVRMRSRTLTDAQRILIIAYLSAGYGRGTTSQKVGCGNATVYRYRRELEETGEPVDLSSDISTREWDILCDIIESDIMRAESSKSTSNCAADSD